MNECLNGTWAYTHFHTHFWGLPFFFLTSQQLQKIWRNNIIPISQLRKLRFLKKVTYLPKLASSGI